MQKGIKAASAITMTKLIRWEEHPSLSRWPSNHKGTSEWRRCERSERHDMRRTQPAVVCMYDQLLSRVQLFVTPWTPAGHCPLSTGFSRQEYWSGLPFRTPGDLSDPGIKLGSPALQEDSLPLRPLWLLALKTSKGATS